MNYRITMLGVFAIFCDDQADPILTFEKVNLPQLILAYCLCKGGNLQTCELVEAVWDAAPTPDNLERHWKTIQTKLPAFLPALRYINDKFETRISISSSYTIDVDEFLDRIEASKEASNPCCSLIQAVLLYKGAFLDQHNGSNAKNTAKILQWLEDKRSNIDNGYYDALKKISGYIIATNPEIANVCMRRGERKQMLTEEERSALKKISCSHETSKARLSCSVAEAPKEMESAQEAHKSCDMMPVPERTLVQTALESQEEMIENNKPKTKSSNAELQLVNFGTVVIDNSRKVFNGAKEHTPDASGKVTVGEEYSSGINEATVENKVLRYGRMIFDVGMETLFTRTIPKSFQILAQSVACILIVIVVPFLISDQRRAPSQNRSSSTQSGASGASLEVRGDLRLSAPRQDDRIVELTAEIPKPTGATVLHISAVAKSVIQDAKLISPPNACEEQLEVDTYGEQERAWIMPVAESASTIPVRFQLALARKGNARHIRGYYRFE